MLSARRDLSGAMSVLGRFNRPPKSTWHNSRLTACPVIGPIPVTKTNGKEAMLRIRYLLPLAAVAIALIGAAPSRGETIVDEWQNVKAPPAPVRLSLTSGNLQDSSACLVL